MEQRYLAALANRDYRRADELVVKVAFLTLLFNDRLYIMDSEPALGRGYADLVVSYPGLKGRSFRGASAAVPAPSREETSFGLLRPNVARQADAASNERPELALAYSSAPGREPALPGESGRDV